MTAMAGGTREVDRLLDDIDDVWLDGVDAPFHLDLHPAEQPRAAVVFQPGSGSHARFSFLAAGCSHGTAPTCW